MTVSDVMARPDYGFQINSVLDFQAFLKTMRSGNMEAISSVNPMGDGDYVHVATVEVGSVCADIDLYYYIEYAGGPEEQVPDLSSYVFLRTDDGWESYDYMPFNFRRFVDWRADDWMEQLQKEVVRVMISMANENEWDFDKNIEWY